MLIVKKIIDVLNPHLASFVTGVLTALAAILVGYFITVYWLESTAEIEQLIADEARYALQAPCGAEQYAAMFTEDAEIADGYAKKTYSGRKEIASRFRELPRFEKLSHDLDGSPDISDNNSAYAKTTSTIVFEDERHVGHEEWWFKKTDGRWKIKTLRYNNP